MGVEFTDNSMKVKSELEEAITAFLYEAAGELEARAKRNSRPVKYGKHDVKNSWTYEVEESEQKATVGSPLEASYWEEFGTGKYAKNGDGRKGWWVYVEGNDTPRKNQKYYTKEEAEQTVAYLRSKGLPAYATEGTEANRPLERAFTSLKNPLIRKAEEIVKGRME